MNGSVRHHAPQVVAGCGLIVFGLVSVLSGEVEGTVTYVTKALLLFSGVSMLLGTAYETVVADTDRTERIERQPISSVISLLAGVFLLVAAVLIVAA